MSSSRRVSTVLGGVLLVSAMVLASCAPTMVGMETGPRAWVGGPPDGSDVPLGAVSVMCHGFAPGGVAHLELWINGAFANRGANTTGGEYFTASLSFETTGTGSYVVHCRTYGQDGAMVQSEPVTLRVAGEEPTPTTGVEIPTATPTPTEPVPTATVPPPPPTATQIPPTVTRIPPTSTPIPPTSTPRPPTATPQPVRIASFEVTKSQIKSGECVRFTWQVAGAPTAIYFDGEGVGNAPDSRDRCPTATREFVLEAQGHGGPVTARLTVVVQGDTTGPTVQRVADSPDPIYWHQNDACQAPTHPNQVTIGAYITDASGISAAKVVYRMTGGSWQSVSMTQVQTGMYSATIGPNDLERSLNPPVAQSNGAQNSLEYYVQAFDQANNSTDSPSQTVTVQYCYIIT